MVKVQVGEHNYYLDGYLKSNLDFVKHDVKRRNFDSFVLIAGREGFGKTTLALQVALYCDPTFNLSRVCFTPDQFLTAVQNAEKHQAIVFDETMWGLGSRSVMTKINKVLIKVISEMRSKNLYVFMCIPNFFMMDWYISQHRSTGFLYVYKRGFFGSYDYLRKKKLYVEGKRMHSYHVPPNFRGKSTKYFCVDPGQYEIEKQKAINSWASETKLESLWKKQRNHLIKLCIQHKFLSTKELSEELEISIRQIQRVVQEDTTPRPTI